MLATVRYYSLFFSHCSRCQILPQFCFEAMATPEMRDKPAAPVDDVVPEHSDGEGEMLETVLGYKVGLVL